MGILTLIRLRRRLTWTAFLLLACSGGVMAQLPPLEQAERETPVDLDSLRFYLITVDVGNNVWDNFGHTALRLYDENTNTDLVFNWGVFDISGGVADFSYNFLKASWTIALRRGRLQVNSTSIAPRAERFGRIVLI